MWNFQTKSSTWHFSFSFIVTSLNSATVLTDATASRMSLCIWSLEKYIQLLNMYCNNLWTDFRTVLFANNTFQTFGRAVCEIFFLTPCYRQSNIILHNIAVNQLYLFKLWLNSKSFESHILASSKLGKLVFYHKLAVNKTKFLNLHSPLPWLKSNTQKISMMIYNSLAIIFPFIFHSRSFFRLLYLRYTS